MLCSVKCMEKTDVYYLVSLWVNKLPSVPSHPVTPINESFCKEEAAFTTFVKTPMKKYECTLYLYYYLE